MAILDKKWQGENAYRRRQEKAVKVGGQGSGGGETLHNKNVLNYRMKPSSNCVIRLCLFPSWLAILVII